MSNSSLRLSFNYWKRLAIIWGVVLVAGLLVLWLVWSAFYVYVPAGNHLIVISKEGSPLPPSQVLAEAGQKGIRKEVLGEGWHFIMPIAYTSELGTNTSIPPGKVGIITARGGTPLPPGRLLAEEGEQGIQRHVLPP